jgi:hypothetical protein
MAPTKPTIASLPLALRGLVLDHLKFNDVLKATTTDRAGREALRSIKRVCGIKEANLMPNMLSKLSLCYSITIYAKSAVIMERLAWVLRDLRHLREVKISFYANADMSSWSRSCGALARSMDDVSRIEVFHLRMHNSETLKPAYLGAESFHAILFRLPLNSALEAAMHGQVPHDVVNTLLSRGANPNHVALLSSRGSQRSMLSKACLYQTVNVVQLLLEQGARSQPETYDCFQWTLMRKADHPDVLRLLYDAGLLPFQTFPAARKTASFLHHLMEEHASHKFKHILPIPCFHIVKLIVERQPELVLLSDRQGRTPLSLLLSESPASSPALLQLAKVLAEAEQDARLRGTL